jgi:hypothetical protein
MTHTKILAMLGLGSIVMNDLINFNFPLSELMPVNLME